MSISSRTPPRWQWALGELTARGEGLAWLALLLLEHTDWCERACSAECVPGTVGKLDETHLFFKNSLPFLTWKSRKDLLSLSAYAMYSFYYHINLKEI